jgi:hypothetical protein
MTSRARCEFNVPTFHGDVYPHVSWGRWIRGNLCGRTRFRRVFGRYQVIFYDSSLKETANAVPSFALNRYQVSVSLTDRPLRAGTEKKEGDGTNSGDEDGEEIKETHHHPELTTVEHRRIDALAFQ